MGMTAKIVFQQRAKILGGVMNSHFVYFKWPIFFLRSRRHYRDETEWREACRRFFESLQFRDGVSLRRARSDEDGKQAAENPDARQESTT
jgi:hypothetical protein